MKRVVVKVGTKVLSNAEGSLDMDRMRHLVEQIAILKRQSIEVILVSSGAVGAGRSLVVPHEQVSDTVHKQIYAAVGQTKLMGTYTQFFGEHELLCAQVLATKEDFRDEDHYMNMKNCFKGLLLENVVPIVNENDVVATTELLFTDNDELAGLVAEQVEADTLVLLTMTDGILDHDGRVVDSVTKENRDEVLGYIHEGTSDGGRGGMVSKFTVGETLAKANINVVIANGTKENTLTSISEGAVLGTTFL